MDSSNGRLKFSTPIFEWTATAKEKIIVHSGGTSSGKTYSILEYLFAIACEVKKRTITVVGQDIPNLRVGAYRDAQTIVFDSAQSRYYQSKLSRENKSNREFHFKNGSVIEFKSYDSPQDAKSGKRDILFINEANGVPYEIYAELQIRTKKRVIIDFNPTAEFWAHKRLMNNDKVAWFNSTYKDNPFISQEIVKGIEQYEPTPENIARGTADKYRWEVYGLGKIGRREGAIFTNWERGKLPEEYKWRMYGLDWGFTNDPSALVEIRYAHGKLYVKELIYRRGLTNQDISKEMDRLGVDRSSLIIADSAEPKSIEELGRMGWHIKPSVKGADSVMSGIDLLRRYRIVIDGDNIANEFLSYIYAKDKDGNPVNKPEDSHNHAIDAMRYAVTNRYIRLNQGNTVQISRLI